ncbi:hypothetical protein DB346_08565 [Verrucomicrobia bacterium LW23]|nr:hypothetical protein DB346_08565 [Verrucomicrobia bacterium LW23]
MDFSASDGVEKAGMLYLSEYFATASDADIRQIVREGLDVGKTQELLLAQAALNELVLRSFEKREGT